MYSISKNNAIHERAWFKAFAKIEMLNIQIEKDDYYLRVWKNHIFDADNDQFIITAKSNKTELEVWQYIAELIEKSNKIQ